MILVDRVSCGKNAMFPNKTIVENDCWTKPLLKTTSFPKNDCWKIIDYEFWTLPTQSIFPSRYSVVSKTTIILSSNCSSSESWLFMTSNLPPSPSLLVEAFMRHIVDATERVFFHSSIKAIVIPYMDFYQSIKKLVVPYWAFYRLIKANDSLLVLFYRLIKILMIHHLFFYRLIKIRYSRIWHFYRLIKKMIFSNIEFLWFLHLEQINGYDLWFFEMQIEKSEHQISASKDSQYVGDR